MARAKHLQASMVGSWCTRSRGTAVSHESTESVCYGRYICALDRRPDPHVSSPRTTAVDVRGGTRRPHIRGINVRIIAGRWVQHQQPAAHLWQHNLKVTELGRCAERFGRTRIQA